MQQEQPRHWRDIPDRERDEKYNAYLCSREWGILKQKVRKRAAGMCEFCHVRAMDAVHHLTYIRKFNERLDDLAAICNECHEHQHALRDNPEFELNEGFIPIGEEVLPCIRCGGGVKDGLARNGKGEWFCDECAMAAEAGRGAA